MSDYSDATAEKTSNDEGTHSATSQEGKREWQGCHSNCHSNPHFATGAPPGVTELPIRFTGYAI